MVNRSDASQSRLYGACALFRQTYGTWPTQARMDPALLWLIATSLDQRTFEQVSGRLRLRTTTRSFLAVGDASRHLVYGAGKSKVTFPDAIVDDELREEARRWLGIVYE